VGAPRDVIAPFLGGAVVYAAAPFRGLLGGLAVEGWLLLIAFVGALWLMFSD